MFGRWVGQAPLEPLRTKQNKTGSEKNNKESTYSAPLEASLTNQSPSWTDAAYFQTFVIFFSSVPLCIKLLCIKKKKRHNKLLSWIKRERRCSLCQSRMKKRRQRERDCVGEREIWGNTLLLLSKSSQLLSCCSYGTSPTLSAHRPRGNLNMTRIYPPLPGTHTHTRGPVLEHVVSFVKLVHSL